MKKLYVLLFSCALIAAAGAQDIKKFQDGFTTFSNDFAAVLSYNATTGNVWSDAFIGTLPHFGVGAAVGITMIPVTSITQLFESMDITLPAALGKYGLPIPATAITAKLGGIILPFDIGLKGMILPKSLADVLAGAGVTADYKLLGASVRYALIKQNLILPNVSVGASYNWLKGMISTPLPITTPSFTVAIPGGATHTLSTTDPSLEFGFVTNSFDFTAQASKKFIFVTPYLGAGLSMGKSAVTGGIRTTLLYDNTAITASNLSTITSALSAAGITTPDISAEGFMFSVDNSKPVFRLFGGVSLNLLVVYFDTMVMYVPVTKSLGANFMIRVQL